MQAGLGSIAIEYAVIHGDVLSVDVDVLALKYAQQFYGVDRKVSRQLEGVGKHVSELKPPIGGYKLINAEDAISAREALFIGVTQVSSLDYSAIRALSRDTLRTLAAHAPQTNSVAMPLHGPGFGLDEVEAALAQLGGCVDALNSGAVPQRLESIQIVEIDERRYSRIGAALEEELANSPQAIRVPGDRWRWLLTAHPDASGASTERQRTPGASAGIEQKPHAFVAMPFLKEMDDIYYFGIQGPVRQEGFICERIDQTAYTGDVIEQMRHKIKSSAVVIADLTGANPNVYLEVGYAWATGRPFIALIRAPEEPMFDLRGIRHLRYERIKDLEELLTKEIRELKQRGIIG